jgi:hypothetical protein
LLLSYKKEESSFLKKRSKRLLSLELRFVANVSSGSKKIAGSLFAENNIISKHEDASFRFCPPPCPYAALHPTRMG